MSNIVAFPTKTVQKQSKVGTLRTKMENLQKMLEKRYDKLVELTLEMDKVADDCDDFESKYEIILTEYAERVGAGNVELKYLDYSSEVEINFDAELNNFKISPKNTEIIFTPED
jgi:hypothetical protein